MNVGRKVHYGKPSRSVYLRKILVSIFTGQLLKDLFKLLAYYCVNHSLGMREATIGKNTNIHSFSGKGQ